MYRLSELRSKKDREEILELYKEDTSNFFRLSPEESNKVKGDLKEFCRDYLKKSGLEGYVIGLSGGLDSSITVKILSEAVPPEKICGVIIPSKITDKKDIEDAIKLSNNLGIQIHRVDEEKVEKIIKDLQEVGESVQNIQKKRIKKGNILARVRMITLRDVAKAKDSLVTGTTNLSEKLLGYTTIAGDGKGGVDIEVLYQLLKTTVKNFSYHLGISENIIEKDPAADLWEGQTDEKELGISWKKIDKILLGRELDADPSLISEVAGVDLDEVERINRRVENKKFKQKTAPYPRLKPTGSSRA